MIRPKLPKPSLLRIRHCFLLIEIWQRCSGMSREKSTQHLVVQGIHSDRRLSALRRAQGLHQAQDEKGSGS
jgi:hypothetical protein